MGALFAPGAEMQLGWFAVFDSFTVSGYIAAFKFQERVRIARRGERDVSECEHVDWSNWSGTLKASA
jgi:hypothetical protein